MIYKPLTYTAEHSPSQVSAPIAEPTSWALVTPAHLVASSWRRILLLVLLFSEVCSLIRSSTQKHNVACPTQHFSPDSSLHMRKQGKQKPSTHTTVFCYYGHPVYLHLPEAGLPKYPGLVVGTLKQSLPSLQGVYTRTMAEPLRYKTLWQHCRFKHIHHLESIGSVPSPFLPVS